MFVSIEILVIFSVVILLFLAAMFTQMRREANLRKMLKDRSGAVWSVADENPDIPEPPPHKHVWASKAISHKLGIGVYPCTVPGCRADPLCHAGRR